MPQTDTDTAQNEANVPQAPKAKRVLNLSIVLGEDADLAGIIEAANDLGDEIQSLSINKQYPYDDYAY